MVKTILILFVLIHSMGPRRKVDATLVLVRKMDCFPLSTNISHIVCELVDIRKGIKVITFNACFNEPIDNVFFGFQVYRKAGSKFNKLVDVCEDYCKVMAKEGRSSIMSRLLPGLSRHGNVFTPCPFQGNLSVTKYPVDFSFLPSAVLIGNYKLMAHLERKQPKKQKILDIHVYIDVK